MTTNEKKSTEKTTEKRMMNKKEIGIIAVATATVAAVIISMLCFSSCNNKTATATNDEVGTSVQTVTQVVTDAQGNTHIEEKTKVVEVKQTQPSEKSENSANNETKSAEKTDNKPGNGNQSSNSGAVQTNNRPGNSQSGSSSSGSGQASKPPAQGGSSEQSKPAGSQSSQPQATKPQPTTADPHAGKTWHEAEYKEVYHPAETEKVWIVDVPAETWQRPIYEEPHSETICNTCGAIITDCVDEHGYNHLINGEDASYRNEIIEEIIGYETVTEPEQGHYETKVVKEAYTEKVLVKEEGWY